MSAFAFALRAAHARILTCQSQTVRCPLMANLKFHILLKSKNKPRMHGRLRRSQCNKEVILKLAESLAAFVRYAYRRRMRLRTTRHAVKMVEDLGWT